jgi:hypothetical protein
MIASKVHRPRNSDDWSEGLASLQKGHSSAKRTLPSYEGLMEYIIMEM